MGHVVFKSALLPTKIYFHLARGDAVDSGERGVDSSLGDGRILVDDLDGVDELVEQMLGEGGLAGAEGLLEPSHPLTWVGVIRLEPELQIRRRPPFQARCGGPILTTAYLRPLGRDRRWNGPVDVL